MTTATRKKAVKKTAARKRPTTSVNHIPTDREIRDWAVSTGVEGVQMKGRVSRHLREMYVEAGSPKVDLAAETKAATDAARQPISLAKVPPKQAAPIIEVGARPQVFIVRDALGRTTILKDDAVYVEEVMIDDTDADRIMESLGKVTALPKGEFRTTLAKTLSTRLAEVL